MKVSSLLSIEARRFLPNGTFRTLVVLYLLLFAGGFRMTHLIGENFQMTVNGDTVKPLQDMLVHPKNWQLLAWVGSWANVLLMGFLGVFMITSEFQHKTLRQSVIFGLTRGEVAASKGIFAVALSLAGTGVYLALGSLVGIFTGTLSLPPWFSLLGFFLQALGYLAIGTLVGLFIRQTALAIILYLAYVLFLETVARWMFAWVVGPTRAWLFLPDKVLEALASFPVPQAARQAVRSVTASLPAELNPFESGLAATAYLALFAILFTRHLQKADL
ncbi:MAG: hypothetical protein SFU85_08375 [Candidatus Methylacidiphilales bacterium]|nr:hypothetical protein [Candidatus Methylacidiphilales bacterium]